MSHNNTAILEAANAAITRGDYETFLAACTDDTVWTFVGERTLRGKDEVRSYMATAYTEPPQFSVTNLIDAGDYVTALGNITIKHEVYAYCDVWRFRDGQMAELQAFVIKLAPAETPL